MSAPAPVVAIDGPSGSGKGTVSRRVAERLGWHLLDSGAIYRLLALAVDRAGVDEADDDALERLAVELDVSFESDAAGEPVVRLEGDDVSRAIRSEACGDRASRLAARPVVRRALLERQRAFRRAPGLVADGRDMGTVVFPDAQAKIFLTASAEERARRRHKQLNEQGLGGTLTTLLEEIAERDRRDASRPVSPLVPAPDAVTLDTTGMSVDQVVEAVMSRVRPSLGEFSSQV